MTDTHTTKALCVEIYASDSKYARYTDCNRVLTVGGNLYTPVGTLTTSEIESHSNMDNAEVRVIGIDIADPMSIGLATHMPFGVVKVNISVAILSDDMTVMDTKSLFKGLLYKVIPNASSNKLILEARPYKYYADIMAGIPAIEQCHAPRFGDPVICKKAVATKQFSISEISNSVITVLDTVQDVDKSFNKGSVSYGGVQIKIKHWVNGKSFLLSQPPPVEWLNKRATFSYGCDKYANTCSNTHNNISRFMGAGIGMMSYDPLYSIS